MTSSLEPSTRHTCYACTSLSWAACRLPDASATVATLWETSAGVGSLTLEDPWLAAALSDGTVALLNTEVAMRQRHHGRPSSASLPPRRVFQLPGGAAYCADLADQWLIAGSGQYCVQVQVEMLNLAHKGVLTMELTFYQWYKYPL